MTDNEQDREPLEVTEVLNTDSISPWKYISQVLIVAIVFAFLAFVIYLTR